MNYEVTDKDMFFSHFSSFAVLPYETSDRFVRRFIRSHPFTVKQTSLEHSNDLETSTFEEDTAQVEVIVSV